MATVCKGICGEELDLLHDKGVSPEWWDKEIYKITYKIASELIEFSSEVKDTQENSLKRALFALNDRILLSKKQKCSILKKIDRFLKNKANNLLQVYETFYNIKSKIKLEISVMKLVSTVSLIAKKI